MFDRRILGAVLAASVLVLPACASRGNDAASSEQSSGFRLPSKSMQFQNQ